MERLWRATVEAGGRELTLATLVQLGGAQRIVETHLVDALGALDPREQDRGRRLPLPGHEPRRRVDGAA